jgi:hypothetical protein
MVKHTVAHAGDLVPEHVLALRGGGVSARARQPGCEAEADGLRSKRLRPDVGT